MYCTKCGAQIPDGSMFCTSCGARVGGTEDQAEPVAFPVGDAPASAPVGQQTPQGAPVHMAAQPRYEEPMTEPAEAAQPFVPTPQPKKPKHRGRIVAAVIGGVAVVAIVAAIVIVPRIGASSEVTSGGKGYVVCACETKVLPKNSKGKKLKSYTVELAPVSGKGKSYTIKVDGEDGFAMEDFGELPDQKYQMTITSGKGKKKSTTTMKVDYAKEGSDAPKNVELTQSKKEAKASAKAAVKTANELFTDKILEYQKKYGEGEAVEIDDSSMFGTRGVAYAKLIDFDGDGQDELLIEYSDEPIENDNGATAAKVEVWAYRDGEIEKVYEPDTQVYTMCAGVSLYVYEYDGTYGFKRYLHDGETINFKDVPNGFNQSHDGYECEFNAYDGKSFGSVRPGLTFRPIIFLRLHNGRPLAGFKSGKGGAMRPRPDELLARPRRFMPTCRLTRRLPVGRRRLDPHLERHPALADERPEERVDGGGHGQPELVQDGRGLLLDLRFDADRRGRYVRRHGCTFPRISRCNYFIVSMRRARPSSPYRAAPR